MQARCVMHSGDRNDSNISSLWQRSVCVLSSSLKNKLPAKRLAPTDKHWNKQKIIHFNATVRRKVVTLAKFQFIHLPKCVWLNCGELIRKIILQHAGCVFPFINSVLTVVRSGVLSDVSDWLILIELPQCSCLSCYCVHSVCVLKTLTLKQEIYTKSWSENPEKSTLLWRTDVKIMLKSTLWK